MRAIGLMSGTSMDGIDLAVLDTDGDAFVRRGPAYAVPYEPSFRARLAAALDTARAIRHRAERPGDLAALEREITSRHARAVEAFRDRLPSEWADVDLIGFHGQTVLHRPAQGLTVQLGNGGQLAAETGLPVVGDMRAADMENGGQGAPLVPAYHAALARSLPAGWRDAGPVAFVNIGGISNITVVGDAAPVAFDTGPGNSLIDQWVQRETGADQDTDGRLAARGRVHEGVVARILAHPFFAEPGPKSLDRGDFTLDLAEGLSPADGARTLAALAARAILRGADHLAAPPALWILCGGGRHNPHIVADLRAQAGAADVATAEEVGFDGDATEAEAWAYLAVRARRGLALTYPTTTGARAPTPGGVFHEPRSRRARAG